MTSFLRKVFTFTQPKTASTSKTAARPNPKTTAASSQQVADGLTLFNAFDMDSEDDSQEAGQAYYGSSLEPPPNPNNPTSQATEVTKDKKPRTFPPECKSAFCPVIKIRGAKPHGREDWDLPEMIQHFQAHVDNLMAQKKFVPTHLFTLLDRFYTVHGTVGNFDVPMKPETVAVQSVGERNRDVNEGSAADNGIITVRRLYAFKGVPDAQKFPLRPATQVSNPKNDAIGSTGPRGGGNDAITSSAAEKGDKTRSNDGSAAGAEVDSETQNTVYDPMAWW